MHTDTPAQASNSTPAQEEHIDASSVAAITQVFAVIKKRKNFFETGVTEYQTSTPLSCIKVLMKAESVIIGK